MSQTTESCRICGASFIPRNICQVNCLDCAENPRRARRKVLKSRLILGNDKTVEWECHYCGKEYKSRYPKEFCSPTCTEKYNDEHVTCATCGQLLSEIGIHFSNCQIRHSVYCSEKCKHEAALKRARERGRTDFCPHCGQEFIVDFKKDHYRQNVKKRKAYCCLDCAKAENLTSNYMAVIS